MTRRMASWLAMAVLMTGSVPASPLLDAAFEATAILERRPPGAPPRVRFEWDRQAGAVEYLLSGSWTRSAAWTVERREFRVTRRSATSWTTRRVTFEVSLPPGDHSWTLAPVSRPNGPADRDGRARLGFELR